MTRHTIITTIAFLLATALSGCSACTATDEPGASCPPERPVERDGVCYRARDDAGNAGDDASVTPDDDAGNAGDDGGGPPGDDSGTGVDSGSPDPDSGPPDAGPPDAGPPDAGTDCTGMHPLVEGSRRFCMPGWCYCRPSDAFEACYLQAVARTCCPVDPVCMTSGGT